MINPEKKPGYQMVSKMNDFEKKDLVAHYSSYIDYSSRSDMVDS
jgi:hypothetical protein